MPATALVAAAVIAAVAAASPPTAPPPAASPPVPPKVFAQAGYAEPDVGPSACRIVSPGETQCVVPAMTAGVYLVRVAASSTAQAAGAVQQITIVAGPQSCTSTRNPDPKAPWAAGARRTLLSGCVFTIVTDTPLAITAVYLDAKAAKDPGGPQMTVTREPWNGVLNAMPVSMKQP